MEARAEMGMRAVPAIPFLKTRKEMTMDTNMLPHVVHQKRKVKFEHTWAQQKQIRNVCWEATVLRRTIARRQRIQTSSRWPGHVFFIFWREGRVRIKSDRIIVLYEIFFLRTRRILQQTNKHSMNVT